MNRVASAGVSLLVTLISAPALAHSPTQGIGDFYNGILHPLVVPSHLLLLIASGLLFGQNGMHLHRVAFLIFIVATLLGLAGKWPVDAGGAEIFILSVAAIIGLFIAVNPNIRSYPVLILAGLAGFLIGVDSTEGDLAGRARLVMLIGTGLGIYLLISSAMVLADTFRTKPWQQIGLRVIGSWIAASSLLVLALSYSELLAK